MFLGVGVESAMADGKCIPVSSLRPKTQSSPLMRRIERLFQIFLHAGGCAAESHVPGRARLQWHEMKRGREGKEGKGRNIGVRELPPRRRRCNPIQDGCCSWHGPT